MEIVTDRKYVMTDETKVWNGHVLHRIKCVVPFLNGNEFIQFGTLGGFIESYDNLKGCAWVFDDAIICGDAIMGEFARIRDKVKVCGHIDIKGHAIVRDNAKVEGSCVIKDYALIGKEAKINVTNALFCGYCVVSGRARIEDEVRLSGECRISGKAVVKGGADICGYSHIRNYAIVGGYTKINGNSIIGGYCQLVNVVGESIVIDKNVILADSIKIKLGKFAEIHSNDDFILLGDGYVWLKKEDTISGEPFDVFFRKVKTNSFYYSEVIRNALCIIDEKFRR